MQGDSGPNHHGKDPKQLDGTSRFTVTREWFVDLLKEGLFLRRQELQVRMMREVLQETDEWDRTLRGLKTLSRISSIGSENT